MTFNNIYEFFENDQELLKYYDPTSLVTNNKEAAMEIYHKLIEHSRERKCSFYRSDLGYIFYSSGLLISFCVKPELRVKENLIKFSNMIKQEVGKHFECYLYNNNKRGINFLKKMGMDVQKSNDLITLLSI